ncbi:SET domain-containing protein-lysine N-methyltransferase [Paraburkholderia sp. LEh10]|uniref:SET domain-containing protein n=1 Tax=Paraburkholderia sp. LEh10 TaxID=2821353 RepID=UPI001AEB822E|nr:SET domain-containing protein-lysine N-methyltransferase [Paraburkholderia sp. LEh10]MBP0596007.1 SET domain-containing protein-lysine N-methyltransferase [Paraburkholderia sp. LEh10]
MPRTRRISARHSPVHGTGLFALQPVEAGERLIEYKGEVTSWRRAAARQRSDAGHTFVFGLSDGRVIDGSRGGNSARFLNHACDPNCEAIEVGDRVFIHALTAIDIGEELFIDYGLAIDGEITDEVRAQYACHCGASDCRRSMIGGSARSP